MTSTCGGGNAAFRDGGRIEGFFNIRRMNFSQHCTVNASQLAAWKPLTVDHGGKRRRAGRTGCTMIACVISPSRMLAYMRHYSGLT